MQPTTTGRFRVLDGRGDAAAFVLSELPDEPGLPDVDDPEAAEVYDPVHVAADGYEGGLAATVDALKPGFVVRATLAWDDGEARFDAVEVERESRIYVADDVTGMFEAATEAWREARAAGEGMTSLTTRSQDGEPNGALYCFADAPGRDLLAELRSGTVPVDPLVARVNARREDDRPRAIFLMRPKADDFVAVYVVFDRDGVLASTIRDTYDIRSGLVDQLEVAGPGSGIYGGGEGGEPDGDGIREREEADDRDGQADGGGEADVGIGETDGIGEADDGGKADADDDSLRRD